MRVASSAGESGWGELCCVSVTYCGALMVRRQWGSLGFVRGDGAAVGAVQDNVGRIGADNVFLFL